MNLPSLHLRSLSGPKLDEKALRLSVQRLSKVTAHLGESGTLHDDDLVAELRMRVRDGYARGESFDVYTSVSRRESRILSLYLMDLASQADRIQLPLFDKAVAISVLGHRSQKLKKHIRRQATQLFFTHFDEELLPCLEWIASRLQASWRIEEMHQLFDSVSRAFREHAGLLFNVEAPTAVAERWDQRESVDHLADRFGIPQGGKFRERLMGEVILRRLTLASHGAIPADLDDLVTKSKERPLSGGPLGSEAVKILINRSTRECNGQVPAGWREQLVTYSCDPRVPNAAEQAKWWGWATPGEKDIAIRALSELTLQEFIKLLERSLRGTEKAHQFPERKRVLLKLFELGKVTEARLVVHQGLYNAMGSRTREVLRPSRTRGGRQQTSFICLRCTDDVFLIEGTHDFALRGFIGRDAFPISSFWSAAPKLYDDEELRTQRTRCQVYQVHHQGDWVSDFTRQLRRRHIEWRGI